MSLNQLAALALGTIPRGRARAAPPPAFARFVLDPAALGLMEGPLLADDEPYAEAASITDARPQSLLLTGRLRVGSSGVPLCCRPLFPGRMLFRATSLGTPPQPKDVSRSAYPNWPTQGILLVDLLDANGKAVDPTVLLHWATLTRALGEAAPTRMWYGPVQIPAEFLFDALPLLAPREAPAGTGDQLTPAHRQRISELLAGTWGPVLRPPSRTGACALDDPVSGPWMPHLVEGSDRGVSLRIAAARTVIPFDGTMAALEAAAAVNVKPVHPAHPGNAAVPARLVYQTVSAAGGLAHALPSSVAAGSLGYRRVKVTRIWTTDPDCSVHFPAQVVVLTRADGSEAARQRLAAHGLLFHGMRPADSDREFTLTLSDVSADGSHPLRWLVGGHVGDDDRFNQAWQRPAGSVPVPVDLTQPDGAHVIARLPMAKAMFAADTRPYPSPGGWRCTYLSMRRAVRALIDNRIAGGRLAAEDRDTPVTTRAARRLIEDALEPHRERFLWALGDFRNRQPNPPAGRLTPSALVANGRPASDDEPGRAGWFLPFLEAFFPDDMPEENVPGSLPRGEVMRRGKVAYMIWQSNSEAFAARDRTRNFPAPVIGRGGPGALVVSGLADAFFVDAPIVEGRDLTVAERDAMVTPLISRNLAPGSVLQYWSDLAAFNSIRTRQPGAQAGHSPVFLRVDPEQGGDPTGITVVDQYGARARELHDVNGAYQLGPAEIWIAAEWNE